MGISRSALPATLRRVEGPVYPLIATRTSHSPAPFAGASESLVGVHLRVMQIPQEDEDARITGSTRSLARRLLGLNLPGSLHH